MAFFGLKKEKKEKSAGNAIVSAAKAPVKSAPSVLRKPVVSEKALDMENVGKYVFEVVDDATKPEIKKEIEKLYGVKVRKVNVVTVQPQSIFFKGRTGRQNGFKKALVKLAQGQKIEVLPK
ncbi:MAG: 50S ribosomal protein L23 [Candidatus Sungbacteria bacterium]|uniref:Large ribosomal subunit protein uL23 n=1 Tax=Candidatus Sungiibacteriota bacterium TaxID=2750080 RepID=A0A931YD18_9BACT|nr:50S ribosomal protein L23 [Candidatus Sungbacteria bacterium]MBI2465651.1 50S ribosomal protein L23 [Candidatus Sungbacteria bacterium]